MRFSLRTWKSVQRSPRGSLAILIPTYRFDARARHTIAATASLASDDIAVVIGDNSENPQKWDFLRALGKLSSNVHFHLHKRNIGAARNWSFLLEQTELPYYLIVGDDDLCTPEFIDVALRQLKEHNDASAAAGSFIMVTSRNEMSPANRGRTEASGLQRCVNFTIGGGNSLPNSMGRLTAVKPFITYLRNHPLKASFFDWMMAYTLLGQGKYYTEDRGCYLYDVSNWESGEACWRNDAKFYVEAGLPEPFTWFHGVYWAVELSHFFRGAYSPIKVQQSSVACAQHLYLNRMVHFRRQFKDASARIELEKLLAHRPAAVAAARLLVANDDATHPQLFDWFTEVVAAFDRDCALAYSDYVRGSLEEAQRSAVTVP